MIQLNWEETHVVACRRITETLTESRWKKESKTIGSATAELRLDGPRWSVAVTATPAAEWLAACGPALAEAGGVGATGEAVDHHQGRGEAESAAFALIALVGDRLLWLIRRAQDAAPTPPTPEVPATSS